MAYLPGIEGLKEYMTECREYAWMFRHLARNIIELPPGKVPRDSPKALERWVNLEVEYHHRSYNEVFRILVGFFGNNPIGYMKNFRSEAIKKLEGEANFLEDRAITLEKMVVLTNPSDSLIVDPQ